jgi:small multidrug resistance family-3 protein
MKIASAVALTSFRLLIPAAISLACFAWLLSLHPGAAAQIYAAYGGVYIAIALRWLWLVEGQRPTRWDIIGSTISTGFKQLQE